MLVDALLELVAPTRCAGCERPGALICDTCRQVLTRIDPVHACVRCGAPFGDVLCTECRRGGAVGDEAEAEDEAENAGSAAESAAPPLMEALERVYACAVFAGPAPRIIRAYKDAGERRMADELADMLVEGARRAQREVPGRYGALLDRADAVTFVPATAAAYRRRGFDHMEAIARAVSERAGVPLADVLVKHGASDQRKLGRQGRLARAQGLYEVIAPVAGARLLLLDDVITTGATMDAAARALRQAGAAAVDGLAVARVWG